MEYSGYCSCTDPKLSRCCRGHRQPPPLLLIASASVFLSLSLSLAFSFLFIFLGFSSSSVSSFPSFSLLLNLSSPVLPWRDRDCDIAPSSHLHTSTSNPRQGISRIALFTLFDLPILILLPLYSIIQPVKLLFKPLSPGKTHYCS